MIHETTRSRVLLAVATGLLLWACDATEKAATSGEAGSAPRLEVQVAPLSLAGVTQAVYRVTVANEDGDVVWTRDDLTSTQYGDGRGSLSYVGTCDASSAKNTVTLVLSSLEADGSPLTQADYVNPGPLTREVTCLDNQDVAVTFDLTILRNARQGFFDVAVEFSDIFCSAKLDCERGPGQPLELLHNPASDAREQTVVVAFACTAGENQNTTLYLDYLRVVCGDDESYTIDPTGGPGNMGAQPPMVFQTASYRGVEALPGYDKLYWNTAIGLNMAALGDSCSLRARGTASDTPFVDSATPPASTYPFITWHVDLTGPTGALVCTTHPLNTPGSGVYTEYATAPDDAGVPVVHALSFNDVSQLLEVASAGRTACDDAHFTLTADGVVVAAGGAIAGPFVLPQGLGLQGCCSDPCCPGTD